jgi:hypothetical protein
MIFQGNRSATIVGPVVTAQEPANTRSADGGACHDERRRRLNGRIFQMDGHVAATVGAKASGFLMDSQ